MRLLFLLAVLLLTILVERTARFRFKNAPFFRDYFTTDIVYLVTAVVLATWMARVYLAPATAWFESVASFPRLLDLDLPTPLLALFALAGVDLGNYAAHYLLHRSNALWEIHKIHHSSIVVDWLATFRSHFSEQILRNLLGPALLLLIGFPLDATLIATALYTMFAVFNHSNTKLNLRFAETIFITPRLHHLHHVPGGTCQKNFGTVFTFWDRAMGTLETRADFPSAFGVPGEVHTYPQSWGRQFIEPLRRWVRPLAHGSAAAQNESR